MYRRILALMDMAKSLPCNSVTFFRIETGPFVIVLPNV